MIEVKIFLIQPTAPLVESPPFSPETPWDDGFAFKSQITVPNKMTSLQKGIHMAQFQGDEDALVLPVAVTETPILWPPHAVWPISWLIGKDPDAGRD